VNIDTSKPSYVVVYTALVSAAFTAAIMVLNVLASPSIRQNRRLFRQRALVEILFHNPRQEGLERMPSEMTDAEVLAVFDTRIHTSQLPLADGTGSLELLTAYRVDLPGDSLPDPSQIVGYAIRIDGVGFWEPINGYLALGPELKFSRGIVILQQAETPGLGGKITEEEFRRQWAPERNLRLDPNPEGKFVYITKEDRSKIPAESAKAGRHVDAITGATQTSIALMRFVNEDLQVFFRAADAYQLREKGPPSPQPQASEPRVAAAGPQRR
jgi:Na+-transporting NADH:ubiquinone oxidoreductase subunit C